MSNLKQYIHGSERVKSGDVYTSPTLPPKIVYAGFDGLDLSFMGRLSLEAQNQLENARETAQETKQNQLVKLGRGKVAGHVGETGANGGYRWKLDTGPEGEIWFFKRSNNIQDWNIRVSVRAAQLAIKPWQDVRDGLYETLEKMGASVLEESIARVDFAVDFLADGFRLEPENFICAHQSTKSVYGDTLRNVNPKAEDAHDPTLCNEGAGESLIHYKGRNVGSVTIGKMPNRQICFYNKRTEVIQKHQHKSYWWDVWGLDKDDKNNQVWRVEIRAGGDHLRQTWNLSTWADFEAYIGDVLSDALQKIRYVIPTEDSNASRWPEHEIWALTKGCVDDCLKDHKSGVVAGKIIEGRRDEIAATYEGLMVGLMASYSVAMGYFEDELETVGKRVKWMMEKYLETDEKEFHEKRKRASDKFYFTDERRRNADNERRPTRSGAYGPRTREHDGSQGESPSFC